MAEQQGETMTETKGRGTKLPDIGDVFAVAYPFVRDVTTDVEDGREVPTWNPGIRYMGTDDGERVFGLADGRGVMTLTVIATVRPKGFPPRVLFTRKFTRPDGVTFGKNKLQIATSDKFRRMATRFAHNYHVAEAQS